jgi:hypothetical protein
MERRQFAGNQFPCNTNGIAVYTCYRRGKPR